MYYSYLLLCLSAMVFPRRGRNTNGGTLLKNQLDCVSSNPQRASNEACLKEEWSAIRLTPPLSRIRDSAMRDFDGPPDKGQRTEARECNCAQRVATIWTLFYSRLGHRNRLRSRGCHAWRATLCSCNCPQRDDDGSRC